MRPDVESAVEKALENVRSGAVDRSTLQTEVRKKIREVISKNYRAYPGIMPLVSTMSGAGEKPRKAGRRRRPSGASGKSA
jgi:hypothetical protein